MKPIRVSALVPGMIVAKDIFDATGLLMLNEGSILTAELITKLEYWGLEEAFIEEPSPSLKEQQEIAITPQIMAAHERAIDLTGNLMANPEIKDGDSLIFKGMVGDIENQIHLNSNVVLNLCHLKTHDNYLYSHAVNVSIVAIIIGRELRLDDITLKNLGLSALLHDFGMTKINKSVYDQNRKLTIEEWAEIKRHPVYGYELLSGSGNFADEVLLGIRQHHERFNGSGYPDGLSGEGIHLFGRIIAVADVYDACLSLRKHRQRMTPYETLKNLLGESRLFDIKILKALVTSMAIYPIGSFVRLNTGEVAKVVGINHGYPFRPEIRIYLDRNHHKLERPIRINLADEEYTQTYIQETLDYQESEKMYTLLEGQSD
jgi:HD-GYP domain-containing protein (c-di-GMP phosphodiesterase class II)